MKRTRVFALAIGLAVACASLWAGCGADESPAFDAQTDDAVAPDALDTPLDPEVHDIPVEEADVPLDTLNDDAVADTATDDGAEEDAGTDCLSASTGAVGEACSTVTDCDAVPADPSIRQCLTNLSVPGSTISIDLPCGYCTATCESDRDCDTSAPPSSVCVQDPMGGDLLSLCLRRCTSDTDCRDDEGYECLTIPYVLPSGTYCIIPWT